MTDRTVLGIERIIRIGNLYYVHTSAGPITSYMMSACFSANFRLQTQTFLVLVVTNGILTDYFIIFFQFTSLAVFSKTESFKICVVLDNCIHCPLVP